MLSLRRFAPRAVVTLALVAVAVVPMAPATAATSLDARMRSTTAFPQVHGMAEYYGGSGEFEMVIHHAQTISGKRVTVRVDGDLVGRARVRSTGTVFLDRHHGVPTMNSGDVIRVRAPGGTLVSKGTLRVD